MGEIMYILENQSWIFLLFILIWEMASKQADTAAKISWNRGILGIGRTSKPFPRTIVAIKISRIDFPGYT